MNKILSEMPTLTGDIYAPVVPRWLTIGLQVITIVFAVAIAWFSYRDWAGTPLFFKGLECILVPTFIFAAFHPKGWRALSTEPFFLACEEGIYFPFVQHGGFVEGGDPNSWLLVPWENISNFRVEYNRVQEGKCAVFDIEASAEEKRHFFLTTVSKKDDLVNNAVLFYSNSPPSAQKVVAHLQEMQKKYLKSALREKYERSS